MEISKEEAKNELKRRGALPPSTPIQDEVTSEISKRLLNAVYGKDGWWYEKAKEPSGKPTGFRLMESQIAAPLLNGENAKFLRTKSAVPFSITEGVDRFKQGWDIEDIVEDQKIRWKESQNPDSRFLKSGYLRPILATYGGIIGGPPGAFLLGMTGEAITQMERGFVNDPRFENLEQAAKSVLWEGAKEAALELMGDWITDAVSFAFRSTPYAKRLAMKKRAIDAFQSAQGIVLPSQTSAQILPRISDQLASASFGASDILKEFRGDVQPEQIHDFASSLVKRLTGATQKMTPEEAGTLLRGIAIDRRQAFREFVSPLFDTLDEMTSKIDLPYMYVNQVTSPILDESGKPIVYNTIDYATDRIGRARVSLKELKEWAKKELEPRLEMDPSLDNQLANTYKKFAGRPDYVSFKAAQTELEDLTGMINQMDMTADARSGALKKAKALMDKTLFDESNVSELPKEVQLYFKNLRTIYKNGMKEFSDLFTTELVKTLDLQPNKVIARMFPAGGSKQIRALKEALTVGGEGVPREITMRGNEAWNILRLRLLEDMLEKSSANGVLNPSQFMKKMNNLGEPALREIFSPKELDNLRLLSDIVEVTKRSSGVDIVIASIAKGAQIGGAFTAYQGMQDIEEGKEATGAVKIIGGTIVFMSPIWYARAAVSPIGSRYLSSTLEAMQSGTKKGYKTANVLVGRLSNFLIEENRREERMKTAGRSRVPEMKELTGFGGRGY